MKYFIIIILLLLFAFGISAYAYDDTKSIDITVGTEVHGSGSKINVSHESILFEDVAIGAKIKTHLVVDGNRVSSTPKTTKGTTINLEYNTKNKTKNKYNATIDDIVISQYKYDGKTLKDTITIQTGHKIAFDLVIDPEHKLVPWTKGRMKVVGKNTNDTITGVILQKPFGVDSTNKYVEMSYSYDNGTLFLVYDDKNITYPLTIDPTWTSGYGGFVAQSGAYTIVMWNTSGSLTWTAPLGVTQVDYLIVGGGGAGGTNGYHAGGGGGAGGLITTTGVAVTPGSSYSVVVGSGGASGSYGNDSSFGGITAYGGGVGGGGQGGAGGSGGGGSGTTSGFNIGGSGYAGQGNNGGTGSEAKSGGGGGGAGGVGGTAGGFPDYLPGVGGVGIASTITTDTITYAGGGGAGAESSDGADGGVGGGGHGGSGVTGCTDGTDGLGGGGGGDYLSSCSGGDGVIVIKYLSPPPTASFTTNTTSGLPPLTVSFNDTSSGYPTGWVWYFRDVTGNNTQITFSTSKNTTHTFNTGNFSISLVATNIYGVNTSAQSTIINVSVVPPTASFTSNISTGSSPLPVSFTDTSTNTPSSWQWFFTKTTGNLTEVLFSTAQNPTHSFSEGTYAIKLKVSNTGGSSNTSGTYYITSNPSNVPEAGFTTNFTHQQPPIAVAFTDTSTKSPTAWVWNYTDTTGGGVPITFSTSQNAEYTFSSYGNYYITLTVSNADGSTTATGWINVTPGAAYTVNNTAGLYPLAVQFNDTSGWSGVQWYYWNFGDGTSDNGTEANPTHTYFSPGTYQPALTIFDGTYMSTATCSTISVSGSYSVYQSHTTHFVYKTWDGVPVSGANVTIEGQESTLPLAWIFSIFNLNVFSTPIHNSTMFGLTDDQGGITFVTIPTVYYTVNIVKPDIGVNQTDVFYGSETEQLIILYSEAPRVSTFDYSTELWNAPINETTMKVGANYSGTGAAQTNVTFYALYENKSVLYQLSEYNITIRNYTYDITGDDGEAFYWGIKINTSIYNTPIEERMWFRFNQSYWRINPFKFSDGSAIGIWLYNTASVFLLILLGGIFTRTSIKAGAVVLPLIAMFLAYYNFLSASMTVVTVALVLGVMIYLRYAESESQ